MKKFASPPYFKHLLRFIANYKFCFLICFQLGSTTCFSQNRAGSLLNIVHTSKDDTLKVNALNELFLEFEFADQEKAAEYLKQALETAKKSNFKKGLATTYTYYGYFSEDLGDYPGALKHHISALKTSAEITDKKGIAASYNNIGIIYFNQGNYPQALKHQLMSLKIKEEINDKKGLATTYNSLGNVYSAQGNYPEALKNYFSFMKIEEKLGNKSRAASAYNNIGIIYKRQGNYAEALKHFYDALKIHIELNDKKGIARCYNNIGNVYLQQNNFEGALKNYFASLKIEGALGSKTGIALGSHNIATIYFLQARDEPPSPSRDKKFEEALKNYQIALQIREAMGDKAGIAETSSNIGILLTYKRELESSQVYLIKAQNLSNEIGNKELIKDICKALARLDSAKGDYKQAFENYKLHVLYRDSLYNEETQKKTIQNQLTYDFEKKEAVAMAEHKKELENQQILSDEKSRKQKIVLLLISCFLILVLVFAGLIFRSLRITRKQKHIIELQKDLVEKQKQKVEEQKLIVEEKQKEIIDSITYARRIQQALLPTEKHIDRTLKRLSKG